MDILTGIASFVFVASLKGTVVLALVLIAQKALGRYLSASGRYRLWIAVVMSLVTPVGFDLRLPQWPAMNPFAQRASVHALPAAFADGSASPARTQAADAALLAGTGDVTSWDSMLAVLWLAGVLAVLAAMAGSTRRVHALARNANAAPESLHAMLRDCSRQAGCATTIRLLASPDLRTPLIAGVFRPVLLWPAGLETLLTPTQLQHVLLHEITHVKRGDIFSACGVAMLQALHWFNPAIWIAFSRLREDREMACDAATVRTVQNIAVHDGPQDYVHDYAHTLIQLGAMQPAPAQPSHGLGILDSHAQLRRRIHMLAQTADPTARHFLSGALLLAFSALAFSQPTAVPRMAEVVSPVPAALPGVPVPVSRMQESNREPIAALPEPVTAVPEPIAAMHELVAEPVVAARPGIVDESAAQLVAEASEPPPPAPLLVPEPKPTPDVLQVSVRIEPIDKPAFTSRGEELLVASADSIGALPAAMGDQPVAPDQAVHAPQSVPAAAQDDDALICRRVNTPGSRVRTRLCLTEKQWAEGNMVPTSAFVRGLSPIDFLEPLHLSMF